MKKIKWIIAVILVIMLSFSTIGCGSKNSSNTNANGSTQDNKEPVNLRFTYWGSPFEKQVIEKAMKDFESKNPGITVEPIYIPSDYTAKLTAMIAGNTAPDVGYVSDGSILLWAEEDKFLNLNDFFKKDNDSNFKLDNILNTAIYRWAPDKIAGLASAQEGFALMYNVDMFKSAGVELPPTKNEDAWTWDKFVEVCQKLTIDENGKNALDPAFNPNKIKQYGFQVDNYIGCWMTAVVSNGGSWLTADGKEFGLTKPEAVDAIQKLADLINKYHVAPSPVQMKSIPDITIALQSKKIAMTLGGNWSLLDFAQQDMNLGIGVFPKLNNGSKTFILSGATAIFKTTKHPEEAWKLLKFLEDPSSCLELQSGGLWMPILKNWYTDPNLVAKWATGNKAHPEGYTEAMMKQVLSHGVASPAFNVKNFGKMNAIVTPALDKVWLGEETAESALKKIEPQIKPLIQGYYDK